MHEFDADGADTEQGPIAPRRDRRRVTIGRAIFIAIVLFMLGACAVRVRALVFPSPVALGLAPAVTLTTFDGQEIALEDLRGQGVVVNFWASWCAPCRAEMPLLAEAAQAAADAGEAIVFVGVAVQDTERAARAFADEIAAPFAMGYDADRAWDRAFDIHGLPETYFIDAEGNLVGHAHGALLSQADLQRRLDLIR
jgi:cytochrome c biogenesis protein CcmG/thiol:disulfide interchange protein DsbE